MNRNEDGFEGSVTMRRFRNATIVIHAIFALCAAALAAPATVAAQNYPARPIRFIVPFPPGGGTDVLTRTLASALTDNLQWRIVVDNRAGAAGSVGVDLAAKSPPDGYTLVMGEASDLAIFPTLFAKLPYDPVKDFQPITLVGSTELVLVVAADKPYKSFADLIAAAKSRPLTMASAGSGGVSHLVGEMLKRRVGIDLLHVPYKGAAPAMADVLAGQVDLYFAVVPAALGLVRNGRLRALAVTTARRAAALPDVPTIAESGYSNFDASAWYGVLVPAGTPSAIVSQLNADITRVLQLPQTRAKFEANGVNVQPTSPEQFRKLIVSEIAKWGQAVKDSGAKID
jgi:tripartite-type tricarboxylate transporter receptor subunit TctC